MSRLRILAVVLVFAGLASVELFTGFLRLSALRESRSNEWTAAITRGHEDLARRLQAVLDNCEQQTTYLAGLPDVAGLLAAEAPPPPPLPERAEATLGAFLEVFTDVEEIRLMSPDGEIVMQLERARPAESRGTSPSAESEADLARVLREGVVIQRIEPGSPSRPALVSAPVVWAGRSLGWVVLTLSPEPLLAALDGFHPLENVETRLVPDDDSLDDDSPGAATGESGIVTTPARRDATGLLLASQVHTEPCFRLETHVPEHVFEDAMAPLGREYLWIVGSMIGVTAALGLVGFLVVRLAQRAFRLHETEHYLRWIRRVTDRYRALMEGAADMILIVEPGGELREANAAARAALGLEGEELLTPGESSDLPGVRVTDHLRPGDRPRFAAALVASSARPGRPVAESGLLLQSARTGELVVDGHFALVDLGDEHVIEVFLRDVTRQRAVERELQTSQRLSSLGLLTAGVAHEINNPLEGIGNYLAILERPTLEPERRGHYIGEIRRGLHRIRDIVQDLLTFSRPGVSRGRADLRDVVDNALGMVRYSTDFRTVTVERVRFDDPLVVAADGRRLEQVVLNLLLNAARAMEAGGRITVALRHQPAVDGVAATAVLEVSDTGPGIDPDKADQLFDPFFSGSGGTGLGLSVSFGIVEAHGGSLAASNHPNGGAVFTLTLPVAEEHGDAPDLDEDPET